MATFIHPTAIVGKEVQLGENVTIGPYSIVEGQIRLEDNVHLLSHVTIAGNTQIGRDTCVFPFAVLGYIPQDKKYQGELSRLEIGHHTTIREHVTVHPGTQGGGMHTHIGDHCLLMVGSHVAHDCILQDHVILANNATLGGHVSIESFAIIGGLSAIHQFVRIGEHAIIGGMTGVEADVIPYGKVLGNRASLKGLNLIGLKRAGFDREYIHQLRKAYRLLFEPQGTLQDRLHSIEALFSDHPGVKNIVHFARLESKRGLCLPAHTSAEDEEE